MTKRAVGGVADFVSTSDPSRRDMLKLLASGSLLALLGSACRRTLPPELRNADRPNIIYMHSHDSGRFVEPYGHHVSTPNMQRFADEGMLFRQAFSVSPTCSPSRAGLLTGMTPGCSGMWGLTNRGWVLNDNSQTLAHHLKKAGYRTALAGVQHIATAKTPLEAAQSIGYDVAPQVRGRLADKVADVAVDYLNRIKKGPFFLDVGFVETHTLPPTEAGSFWGYPNGNPATADIPPILDDVPETRRDMADFAVSAESLDASIGRVLGALEARGLKDHTLVIITTDHGIPLPGHKSHHTDSGLGVMLMMRGPGGFTGGKVTNAMVSQLDIFPTLCELLKLPRPAWLQGTSLTPLVTGEAAEINEAIFAEYESHAVPEPQASVRTQRYKYIRRLDGRGNVRPANTDNTHTKALWLAQGWGKTRVPLELLFDLERDPLEQTNLAALPEHQEALRAMRQRMVAQMARFDNPLLKKYRVADAPPEAVVTQSFSPLSAESLPDAFRSDVGVINSD